MNFPWRTAVFNRRVATSGRRRVASGYWLPSTTSQITPCLRWSYPVAECRIRVKHDNNLWQMDADEGFLSRVIEADHLLAFTLPPSLDTQNQPQFACLMVSISWVVRCIRTTPWWITPLIVFCQSLTLLCQPSPRIFSRSLRSSVIS